MPNLEEVFRLSGVPTYTFVKPELYNEIVVAIRTPGRCVVLEGPSGIGKTTTVTKILDELALPTHQLLSARRPADLELIKALPGISNAGTIVIDDFHRLEASEKASLSDYMKLLADTEDEGTKLVLIGINKAGQQLLANAADASMRIQTFQMGASSHSKISELVSKGEIALNVRFSNPDAIADTKSRYQ